jgi:hypothetical protein
MKVLCLALATVVIVSSASMAVVRDVSAQSLQKKYPVQASVEPSRSVASQREAQRQTRYAGAVESAVMRDPAGPANVSD